MTSHLIYFDDSKLSSISKKSVKKRKTLNVNKLLHKATPKSVVESDNHMIKITPELKKESMNKNRFNAF
jgi:hypothetical protein